MRHALLTTLGLLVFTFPVLAQNVNMEHPQEIHVQKVTTADDVRARVQNLQLQKDAKELGELSAALPADMEGVKQGLLQKDVIERLKRIEKLSKRVREALSR